MCALVVIALTTLILQAGEAREEEHRGFTARKKMCLLSNQQEYCIGAKLEDENVYPLKKDSFRVLKVKGKKTCSKQCFHRGSCNVECDNGDVQCFGNSCRASCTGKNCTSECYGSKCDSRCTGKNCTSECYGTKCASRSNGDYCSSICTGIECEANCGGKECERIRRNKPSTWIPFG